MKRYLSLFALVLWAIGLPQAEATLKVAQPCSEMEQDTNRNGQDYHGFFLPNPDPSQCQAACAMDHRCRAWTYVKPGVQGAQARCWLKNGVPAPIRDTNCISGICSASVFPGSSAPQGQVGTGTTGPITGTPPTPYHSGPVAPPTAAPNIGAPGPSAPSGWPQDGR